MRDKATLEDIGFLHPTTKAYRFTVLLFISLIAFGSYFAYDSIGAIAPSLVESLGRGRDIIGSFYTAYAIAAILSVFWGGVLVDRLGVRKSSLLFSSIVVTGVALVAFSRDVNLIWTGRFILGIGAEPLYVAMNVMIARWFKGKELAFAFALSLVFMRLGTIFSFNSGEAIANFFDNYQATLIAALILCGFSLLINLIFNLLDRRGERILKLKSGNAEEGFSFKHLKEFKASFWYVSLLCVTFYSAVFPFTALSTDFFVDKWGIARVAESSGSFFAQVFSNFLHPFSTAGGITAIPIITAMLFSPFVGLLVDKFGRRTTLMILGSIIIVPAHLVMGLTRIYPVIPMMALGTAFVLIPAAMWPSIPLLVKKERTGTAFGLMTMVQLVGLALFPWLNGILRDLTQSYTVSMIMFASLGFAGLVFALLLRRADQRAGLVLERPDRQNRD
ncbi:MAG: MFS transporter [Candidatus Aminicenantes bacterium]|nr:MFS transporter [Candidatus Aminicenantes bacterium]